MVSLLAGWLCGVDNSELVNSMRMRRHVKLRGPTDDRRAGQTLQL